MDFRRCSKCHRLICLVWFGIFYLLINENNKIYHLSIFLIRALAIKVNQNLFFYKKTKISIINSTFFLFTKKIFFSLTKNYSSSWYNFSLRIKQCCCWRLNHLQFCRCLRLLHKRNRGRLLQPNFNFHFLLHFLQRASSPLLLGLHISSSLHCSTNKCGLLLLIWPFYLRMYCL